MENREDKITSKKPNTTKNKKYFYNIDTNKIRSRELSLKIMESNRFKFYKNK